MTECILNISAGYGPRECQWVVVKLAAAFLKEAQQAGLSAEVLDHEGDRTAAPSCLVKIKGEAAEAFVQPRLGTVRWIGQSQFRKTHKRKNWYVRVSLAPALKDVPELHERDIRYQSFKASGPGGQHVNTTDSAIRAIHAPTGLTVASQDERSQHANKKLAQIKLAMLFHEQRTKAKEKQTGDLRASHKLLERGNEVRVYEGEKFRLRP